MKPSFANWKTTAAGIASIMTGLSRDSIFVRRSHASSKSGCRNSGEKALI
jgi:hypothetical protein